MSATRRTLTVAEPVDYAAWTGKQLIAELKVRGLPHSGAKTKKIDRLVASDANVPELPERHAGWHSATCEMWRDIWTSPMHTEWDDSDYHNVVIMVMAYDDVWRATSPSGRKEAMAEYRLQRADLGLSPLSRRKLEWTIEQAEGAKAQAAKRRAADKPAPSNPAPKPSDDPRRGLELVS